MWRSAGPLSEGEEQAGSADDFGNWVGRRWALLYPGGTLSLQGAKLLFATAPCMDTVVARTSPGDGRNQVRVGSPENLLKEMVYTDTGWRAGLAVLNFGVFLKHEPQV